MLEWSRHRATKNVVAAAVAREATNPVPPSRPCPRIDRLWYTYLLGRSEFNFVLLYYQASSCAWILSPCLQDTSTPFTVPHLTAACALLLLTNRMWPAKKSFQNNLCYYILCMCIICMCVCTLGIRALITTLIVNEYDTAVICNTICAYRSVHTKDLLLLLNYHHNPSRSPAVTTPPVSLAVICRSKFVIVLEIWYNRTELKFLSLSVASVPRPAAV